MLTPSPREEDYGYHIWLGRQGGRKGDRDEEFLADDVAYLDGKFKQRVYIIPSRRLVIVRVGEARAWDDAFLPNAVLRGAVRAARRLIDWFKIPGLAARAAIATAPGHTGDGLRQHRPPRLATR
jgi:hypothetical protein